MADKTRKYKMGRDAGKDFETNYKVKRAHNATAYPKGMTSKQLEELTDQVVGVRKKVGDKEALDGKIVASSEKGKQMRDAKFFKHSTKGK